MSRGMFGPVKRAVEALMPRLLEDEYLSVTITWKVFQSAEFDTSQGVNVETYTEFSVPSLRLIKEMEGGLRGSLAAQEGGLTTSDTIYVIQYSDLPSGASTRDIIVDSTKEYRVQAMNPILETVVRVDVRGYS